MAVVLPTSLRFIFCGIALLLIASSEATAAAQWGPWESKTSFQPTETAYGGPGTNVTSQEAWSLAHDGTLSFSPGMRRVLPLAGRAAPFASAPYSQASQLTTSSPFAPQELSLDDMPVDAESTATSPHGSPAGQGAPRRTRQKSSFSSVFKDFFKKPALHKFMLLFLVLVGAWLLSGLIARIVTVVLSGFVFFKLLQIVEESRSSTP